MEEELKQLKSVLRSLVVSSATEVDVRTLQHDYRTMVGTHLPLTKYGHKEPVAFLKEHFSDCFLFQGPVVNPVLTLIVPDSLKHIDKFVQKQKVNNVKLKGKRRSVQESVVKKSASNLIVQTFARRQQTKKQNLAPALDDIKINKKIENENAPVLKSHLVLKDQKVSKADTIENGTCSQTALKKFLKKRIPYNCLLSVSDTDSIRDDSVSGRLTSSSSSSKRAQIEQLHEEIKDIIKENPNGVWCTDLLRLYRERYNRELNFSCLGYTSVLSLACAVDCVHVSRRSLDDDWLLSDASRPPPPSPALSQAVRRQAAALTPRASADPEDALPGIDFEPDVFPADCMHFLESIPSVSLSDVCPGDMLEVAVAEVYSPSHFWLLRLGERYNIAMEDMMDDMNEYYSRGEGRNRQLALGATRAGHYCASLYDGDWHRSIIVQVLDADTVKVRHVDYGTVERAAASSLRVLPRRYSVLAAQAVRARLAGVSPPAAGRRWPHAASHHFLQQVRDRRLVANVVAAHAHDHALEVLLIDTSTSDDRCLAAELVRSGHADPRPAARDPTSECYLYPRFEALEGGDTPSFAEVHAYLRDGIALDFVHDYRRHVPPSLPPDSPAPAPPPPPAATPALATAPSPYFSVDLPNSPIPLGSNSSSHNEKPLCLSAPLPPEPWRRINPHSLHATVPIAPSPRLPPPTSNQYLHPASFPCARSTERRGVTLSPADCEVFAILSRVDVGAAHRFMLEAMSRALLYLSPSPSPSPSQSRSALNPEAVEFCSVTCQTQPETSKVSGAALRPPPGFETN